MIDNVRDSAKQQYIGIEPQYVEQAIQKWMI